MMGLIAKEKLRFEDYPRFEMYMKLLQDQELIGDALSQELKFQTNN